MIILVQVQHGTGIPLLVYPGPIKLNLQAGRSDYEHGGDYTDYSMGVSGVLVGLDLSLSYIGTDGVTGGCITRTCKERTVFTISKGF